MSASADETPVLDLLASMTADSVAVSSLDPQSLMLVRLAALVAVDAPTASYLLNLGAGRRRRCRRRPGPRRPHRGRPDRRHRRASSSATGTIVDALAVAIEVAEADEQQ